MNGIDYIRIFEPSHVEAVYGRRIDLRQGGEGRSHIAYDIADGTGRRRQEVLRLHDDVILLLADSHSVSEVSSRQSVSEGDWIHLQFRLTGGAREQIGDDESVETGARSCTASRYAEGIQVARRTVNSARSQAACLYFRPRAVENFFGLSPADLPSGYRWLSGEHDDERAHAGFIMPTSLVLSASDLFACDLPGPLRTRYMHAKAIELFVRFVASLSQIQVAPTSPLPIADRERIARLPDIMRTEMARQLTLDQLARRVGINRSKLAHGFRVMYGTTVQAYWRDLRLERARALLSVDQLSVNEVAAAVGYSDPACLTRSFERQFGILPSQCRQGRPT